MRALSVVIPVRDAAATLAGQLDALAAAHKPATRLEIVIADNGSTDGTAAVAHSYADRLPVRVVDGGRVPGINVARNLGARAAVGDWLLFCDGDDEVDVGWLTVMSRSFENGSVLVAGLIDYVRFNPRHVRAWRGADRAAVRPTLGFLPSGHGANFGVTREVFEELGGFDESFAGGGDDTDFFWRAQLAGHELHAVSAVVHYRLRPSMRTLWRQSVAYGASEPLLFLKFASAGMPRRSLAAVLREVWWLATRLPFAVLVPRRGAWLRRLGQQVGRVRGAIRHRTWWW